MQIYAVFTPQRALLCDCIRQHVTARFRIPLLDDFSARRVIQAVAPTQPRHYVVCDLGRPWWRCMMLHDIVSFQSLVYHWRISKAWFQGPNKADPCSPNKCRSCGGADCLGDQCEQLSWSKVMEVKSNLVKEDGRRFQGHTVHYSRTSSVVLLGQKSRRAKIISTLSVVDVIAWGAKSTPEKIHRELFQDSSKGHPRWNPCVL